MSAIEIVSVGLGLVTIPLLVALLILLNRVYMVTRRDQQQPAETESSDSS